MIKKKSANEARLRRHRRVRKKVSGTTARPRLSVFRSAQHIYAQIVDDERMTTIVAASSREKDIASQATAKPTAKSRGAAAASATATAPAEAKAETEPSKGKGKGKPAATEASAETTEQAEPADKLAPIADNRRVAQARLVGKLIAERARAKGIEKIVFDRGGYLYHGRVAALAAGAREAGLDF